MRLQRRTAEKHGNLPSETKSTPSMKIFRLACVASLLLTCGAAAAGARASSPPARWLVVSDIHLNPFARGFEPVSVGSDTNLALFASAVAAMKRAVPNPQVVLLPGDFLAHDFPNLARKHGETPEAAGLATMREIASSLARTFPSAQFAIALGNNDAACGDYRAELGGPYAAALARIWQPLVDRYGRAPRFLEEFARGGNYVAALPIPSLRLVTIDTVPLSTEYRGDCGAAGSAASGQLAWLSSALASTPPGVENVVMMHVPPGYDAFTTETARGYVPWPFLRGGANDALAASLADPAHRVAFAVAGHAHRFDARVDAGVPLLIFGSISPVYHSNPSFFSMRVSAAGTIIDVDEYSYDESTRAWEAPHGFDAAWGVRRVDAATLRAIHERLARDPAMRARWDEQSTGWPSDRAISWQMWGKLWRVPWCAQLLDPGSDFVACSGIERQVWIARLVLALAAAAAVLGAFFGVRLVVRRLRRLAR